MYNETESTSSIISGMILDEDGNTIVYMQAQKTYNDDTDKSSTSANIQRYATPEAVQIQTIYALFSAPPMDWSPYA